MESSHDPRRVRKHGAPIGALLRHVHFPPRWRVDVRKHRAP